MLFDKKDPKLTYKEPEYYYLSPPLSDKMLDRVVIDFGMSSAGNSSFSRGSPKWHNKKNKNILVQKPILKIKNAETIDQSSTELLDDLKIAEQIPAIKDEDGISAIVKRAESPDDHTITRISPKREKSLKFSNKKLSNKAINL